MSGNEHFYLLLKCYCIERKESEKRARAPGVARQNGLTCLPQIGFKYVSQLLMCFPFSFFDMAAALRLQIK